MKLNFAKLSIGILLCSIASCKKDLINYEGIEGVYFAVQAGASWAAPSNWPYQPFTKVEFVKLRGNLDTVQIKVMVTGPAKDFDRPVDVVINPDSTTAKQGVEYEPLAGNVIIPARQLFTYVPVILKRSKDIATIQKYLGLKLVPNKYFGLSFTQWDAIPGLNGTSEAIIPKFDASLHQIIINDFMVQPAVWIGSIQAGNRESGQWGAFSRKKMELMCQIMNLTYADFGSTATMPSVLSGLVGSECAKYLIARYNAGDPVLEDDGRLMFIGNVPWTSYIGVPYVPGPH